MNLLNYTHNNWIFGRAPWKWNNRHVLIHISAVNWSVTQLKI